VKKFLLGLCLLGQMLAEEDPYRQFLNYMNHEGGRILEIEFYQEQIGERFESGGTFYYFGETNYIFDSYDQRVVYHDGTITTINKVDRQVILDSAIPDEVTIFDILTGSNESIQQGKALLEKNGFRIPFTLGEWDMEGTIWTIPSSGQPREIHLKTGGDSDIRIKIISSEPGKGNDVAEINLSNYEIIDLRE
tara:strand:+ start:2883 stop:3458 length:576 start_codon:yes stop_codon:yes gene_type:complete